MDNDTNKLTTGLDDLVLRTLILNTLDVDQIRSKTQSILDDISATSQTELDEKFEDLRTHCKHIDETNKILYNEKVQLLDKNQELQDKLLKLNDLAHEVLLYELQTLDIDFDEYETHVRDTEFSPIVTRCTEMIDLIGYSDKCNKEV